MAIVQKPLRITYQAKNNATGLTDVKAQIYFNGSAKAVAGSALALTEIDATNSPGLYELLIPAATLTGYGVAAGQYNCLEGYVDSASKSAKAAFRVELTVASNDDITGLIGTPNVSLAADIAAIKTLLGTPANTTVSADIAALQSQQTTILSQLTALTNAAQAGAGIAAALPSFLTSTAANTYVIPFTLANADGALIAPTGNVVIGLKNAAGTDRGSYLSGSSGSPAVVNATNASTGQYSATVVIPAGAPEEELIFSVSYTVNGNAMLKYYVCQLTQDVQTSGYALQSTLLSVQTTVNAINSAVGNATYGLSALQGLLANGTYGLSALQGLLANGTYGLSALQGLLANGTYGLSALATLLNTLTTNVAAVQTSVNAVQGTGFVAGTDDLHSLSTFIRANIYSGGRAV